MADGKGATFANSLLQLIFNAVTITGLAQNVSSGALTNLYVALHTADPTNSGNQSTSECNFTGYARVAVARASSGWAVSGETVSPVANIVFGTMTAGSNQTAGWWSIGTASSGSGEILYVGTINPTIPIAVGVTPALTNNGTTVTES